jgi:hypothetical protein
MRLPFVVALISLADTSPVVSSEPARSPKRTFEEASVPSSTKFDATTTAESLEVGSGPLSLGSYSPRDSMAESRRSSHQSSDSSPRKRSSPRSQDPLQMRIQENLRKIILLVLNKVRQEDALLLFNGKPLDTEAIASNAAYALASEFPKQQQDFVESARDIITEYEIANSLLENSNNPEPIVRFKVLINLIMELHKSEVTRAEKKSILDAMRSINQVQTLLRALKDRFGSPIVI